MKIKYYTSMTIKGAYKTQNGSLYLYCSGGWNNIDKVSINGTHIWDIKDLIKIFSLKEITEQEAFLEIL